MITIIPFCRQCTHLQIETSSLRQYNHLYVHLQSTRESLGQIYTLTSNIHGIKTWKDWYLYTFTAIITRFILEYIVILTYAVDHTIWLYIAEMLVTRNQRIDWNSQTEFAMLLKSLRLKLAVFFNLWGSLVKKLKSVLCKIQKKILKDLNLSYTWQLVSIYLCFFCQCFFLYVPLLPCFVILLDELSHKQCPRMPSQRPFLNLVLKDDIKGNLQSSDTYSFPSIHTQA